MKSKSLGQIISESARGEHKAWPLDKAFKAGPHKKRFREGDRQAALWEIYDCAQAGVAIPEWAATAFCDALIDVVTCQITWDDAFGKVPAKTPKRRGQWYKNRIQGLAKNLVRVGEGVRSYNGPKDEGMWEKLREDLKLNRTVMRDCWRRYKLAHNL